MSGACKETNETARARAYLIATSTPGYTMTRQGPERAIDGLYLEFVSWLAAAIAEARGAGLPFAGIFSAYGHLRSASGASPINSIRSIPMGSPSTLPGSAHLARHRSIRCHGVAQRIVGENDFHPCRLAGFHSTRLCGLYGQITPCRAAISCHSRVSLEGMFEVGYSLIAASGTVGASTGDPRAHPFKQSQARTAMSVDPGTKTANNRTTPKTALSGLDSYEMRWPPLSAGKFGWPKGVPSPAWCCARASFSAAALQQLSKNRRVPYRPE